jgi:hypothetical protein
MILKRTYWFYYENIIINKKKLFTNNCPSWTNELMIFKREGSHRKRKRTSTLQNKDILVLEAYIGMTQDKIQKNKLWYKKNENKLG